MPADAYIEAEYESGYVHRETPEDRSPYVADKNIFNDILERRPEAIHGPMVRFSLVLPELTHNVNWTMLPDNARPVWFFHCERTGDMATGEFIEDRRVIGMDFGYQFTDPETGENFQEVLNL